MASAVESDRTTRPVSPKAQSAADQAYTAIQNYYRWGLEHARLCATEREMNADKASQWQAAIRRLMETENELTHNKHSASSADKVVETDPMYRQFLQRQIEVVVEKLTAEVEMTTAKMNGEVALCLFRSEAGYLQ